MTIQLQVSEHGLFHDQIIDVVYAKVDELLAFHVERGLQMGLGELQAIERLDCDAFAPIEAGCSQVVAHRHQIDVCEAGNPDICSEDAVEIAKV